MDTIKPFFAKPNIGIAKRLYDIEPYTEAMKLYLNKEAYQKLDYLESTKFINIPISRGWREYKTSPEIYYTLLNKQLDSALVDLRLISTGIRVRLSLENREWKMKNVEELWIE